jgi:hypothetical protein
VDELNTRAVPWDQIEIVWARNRPYVERPPIPQVGDRLYYRHDEWSRDVEEITVLEVQSLEYRDDPNLWHQVKDQWGVPIIDGRTPRMSRVADPWPWIVFRRDPLSDRATRSRESRLRGSAGWLPLDWRTRPERWRLPNETALIPRPALMPLNVPRIGG